MNIYIYISYYIYIILEVLVCSITVYFYKFLLYFAKPLG